MLADLRGLPGDHVLSSNCHVVTGQLSLAGGPVLNLGGDLVLLSSADPTPAELDGAWVDLFVPRGKLAAYPYNL